MPIKSVRSSAEEGDMPTCTLAVNLEPSALVLLGAVACLAVLAALRVMAVWVEQEQGLHDLKVRSHELRLEVQRKLAQREGVIPYDDEELGEVEVLEPDEADAAPLEAGVEVAEEAPAAPPEAEAPKQAA
jgi:hypothetical protein